MRLIMTFFIALISVSSSKSYAQEVPVLSYDVNDYGQVLLEVASDTDHYYVMKVRHDTVSAFEVVTSITLGEEVVTVLVEPLAQYPLAHYQVLEYAIATPFDTDGDGIDDMTEYNNRPTQGPLNFSHPVAIENGFVNLLSLEDFRVLSVEGADIPWAPFLNGREFAKFCIVDPLSDNPETYFINTNSHDRHVYFYISEGIDYINRDVLSGEIIYHPQVVSESGALGTYSFHYSEGYGDTFEIIQNTHELLAANMPYVANNISYFVTANGEENYQENIAAFNDSRVSVLFEADVYADIDFLAINPAEGYGRLRVMDLEETPGARDIVLYEALPNNLPRVGGIITSFIQTPLSHVNLRAIQDNVPNSFIKEPLNQEVISTLVDNYVHYKVTQDGYILEEATLEEVNAWHDANRPNEEQTPPLNLSFTEILPLEEIRFGMSDGFGAKCTNTATMLTFDFPDKTIPDGFGVPFYYYQAFMKFNRFFEQIEIMIANPEFQTDIEVRQDMLKDLRKDIKKAAMPQWMLDDLQQMHESFPVNTPIRVRSSTNNEDLPGFSGAGLYDSKTQRPDEGHMSKSIKQVYASMWNFRAFDEREYYRVDHFITSMGALCHPNYDDELVNGVGVTTDPIYESEGTFYLNTQVGEDLITNPDAFSIPEELLLSQDNSNGTDYTIIRTSNQLENGTLIMEDGHMDQLREYMNKIHTQFAILYKAEDSDSFAMDIEYKVTRNNQLIIKQARPWSSFWADLPIENSTSEMELTFFPNPAEDQLHFICDCNVTKIRVADIQGRIVLEQTTDFKDINSTISTETLSKGLYLFYGIQGNDEVLFSGKFLKK